MAMNNFLYYFSLTLIILWLIGFLGFNAGGLIHILLFVAVVSVLLKIIKG